MDFTFDINKHRIGLFGNGSFENRFRKTFSIVIKFLIYWLILDNFFVVSENKKHYFGKLCVFLFFPLKVSKWESGKNS